MKRDSRALLGVATFVVLGLIAPARAVEPLSPAANPVANAGPTTGAMADAIAAVEQAKTVPAAVSAFSRGLELDRGNAGLYQAYVRRLVEFRTFNLAVAPSQALVWLQPDNALGLAVLSVDAAERADMRTAVTDAVIAGTRDIDEPFVQHAVAQVVAWYDTASDRSAVPASIVASLEALRPKMKDMPIYAAAYKQAVQAYDDRAAAARQAAATALATAALPAAPPAPVPTSATPQPVPAPQVVNNYYTPPPVASAQPPQVVYAQPNYVYTPDSYGDSAYDAPAVVYPSYGYNYGYSYPSISLGFGYGGGYYRGGSFGGGRYGGGHFEGGRGGGGAHFAGGGHGGGHR